MFKFNELISKATIDTTEKSNINVQRMFVEALKKVDEDSNNKKRKKNL